MNHNIMHDSQLQYKKMPLKIIGFVIILTFKICKWVIKLTFQILILKL